MVSRSQVYVAGVLLLAAVAGLLLSPYFIIDAILVTYLALFVGMVALTEGELPAWASRKKPSPRSKIAYYARWMKAGKIDPDAFMTLGPFMKTLSPFMKAVLLEKDRETISEERLRALRDSISVEPGRAQMLRQPPEGETVSSSTEG